MTNPDTSTQTSELFTGFCMDGPLHGVFIQQPTPKVKAFLPVFFGDRFDNPSSEVTLRAEEVTYDFFKDARWRLDANSQKIWANYQHKKTKRGEKIL